MPSGYNADGSQKTGGPRKDHAQLDHPYTGYATRRLGCKICCRRQARNSYHRYRTKQIERRLNRKYGLTSVEYDRMVAAQSGLCGICGVKPSTKLHIDHDHVTGLVRGLLCGGCNRMLGFAGDNPARLQSAILYLGEE